MKKHFTLLVLLATIVAQNLFAGGPSAPYRFDSTFAQNGFLIDTLTAGNFASYIQYNEILVGGNQDFWIGGVVNGTFLANKFSTNGSPLVSKTGFNYPPYDAAGAYTGVISGNKIYLGGQASNGGHYQNMAYNFNGTTNPIFHQTSQSDSFLTEALYGPQYPVGQSGPNCSDILANGHVVTAVNNFTGDSLYITEFNPTAGVTVSVYPKLTSGSGVLRVKALRTIPGTNSYALLVYNVQGSSTIFIITNGVATATYSFNGVRYNAMIPVSATQMFIGGDNMAFFNVTTGAATAATASLSGVLQLTHDVQTGEIYAFTGSLVYALTSAGAFDNSYNPDAFGNNFNYAYVNADYWLGADVNPNQVFYTDMEMQGSNILISGFTTTLNHQPAVTSYAGFVIKIKGKSGLCDNFSVQLDSVYGTTGCDWNAHTSLTGAFPMTAYINWTGGGSTVTVNSSPYIPTGLCPETYEIVFEDQNHCTGIVNFVTPVPTPCVAPVIHNQLPATNAMCEGEVAQVGPISVTGSLYTHQWYKDGVAVTGATFATFYVSVLSAVDTGDYYAIVTNGCGADTSNVSHLGMIASTTPAIQQTGNLLTAVGYAAGASFQWYFNGTQISGAASATYNATQSGVYSVTAISQNVCSKNSGDVTITVTGIENVIEVNAGVYPNPAKEFLMIYCDENVESIEVYNVIGEQVIFQKGEIKQIRISNLANGVYSLKLTTKNGSKAVKKFIKE